MTQSYPSDDNRITKVATTTASLTAGDTPIAERNQLFGEVSGYGGGGEMCSQTIYADYLVVICPNSPNQRSSIRISNFTIMYPCDQSGVDRLNDDGTSGGTNVTQTGNNNQNQNTQTYDQLLQLQNASGGGAPSGFSALTQLACSGGGTGGGGTGGGVNDPRCGTSSPIAVGASAFISGITVPPAGSNTISIASPVSGATITRNRVIVKGALDPNLKGMQIVIETSKLGDTAPASSFLAHINGVYFAALVPLVEGANIIKVKGTDHTGVERSATITINASPGPDSVLLTYTTPNAGFPALNSDGSTSLDVTLQAIPYIDTPAAYSWDLNGDGTGDLQCNTASLATGRFTSPGMYLPTITVTDSQGKQYKDTTIVNVMNNDDMDGIVKSLWNRLKGAFKRGDTVEASKCFVDRAKDRYVSVFEPLKDQLPVIADTFVEVNVINQFDSFIEYEVVANEDGVLYSYPGSIIRDTDGLWKFKDF